MYAFICGFVLDITISELNGLSYYYYYYYYYYYCCYYHYY